MWRSKSTGVSARIRTLNSKNIKLQQQKCNQSTNAKGGPAADAIPPRPAQTPPTPKPPHQKKSGVVGKLLGVATLGLGGTLAYAWYDEGFRKTLETNIPFSKSALDAVFVYLPDSPTVPAPILREDRLTKEIKELTSGNTPAQSINPSPLDPPTLHPKLKTADTKEDSKKEEPSKAPEAKHELLFVKEETPKERKSREKEEARQRAREKLAEDAAENAALEVIVENLVEVCTANVAEALKSQTRLIEETKKHTDLLKKAMDESVEDIDKDAQWQAVHAAYEDREQARKTSEPAVSAARENLEKLSQAIEEGRNNKITSRNQALSAGKKSLNQLKDGLNKMNSQVAKTETEAHVLLKYKDLTDKAKKQFKQELESVTPEVKLGDRRGKMSEEELNSLIVHAHRRIEQLQKQLAKQIAAEQQKVQQALVDQQLEDEKIADERVRQERSKMDQELQAEKEKWEIEAQIHLEQELRHQKVRDAAAHSDHLQTVINQTEKQTEKQFQRLLHKKLLVERNEFHRELMDWLARVKGIEAAVEGRAETERIGRQAQELWIACISLSNAIKLGQEGDTPEQQLLPLAPEFESIADAASSHPYVQAVVRSIPEIALTRGVWSEENLKERFPKVRRVAKRVAMINEPGSSLAMFFWSYLQSFFIFNTVLAKELTDEVEIEDFDNYQRLNHAKYWMKKGELEQALRFMNQLTGESRRVAEDWITEARLHLEAQQAAKALMAFASASGLGSLH